MVTASQSVSLFGFGLCIFLASSTNCLDHLNCLLISSDLAGCFYHVKCLLLLAPSSSNEKCPVTLTGPTRINQEHEEERKNETHDDGHRPLVWRRKNSFILWIFMIGFDAHFNLTSCLHKRFWALFFPASLIVRSSCRPCRERNGNESYRKRERERERERNEIEGRTCFY